MKKLPDQYFMRRCFELARKGARWVSPNPQVGCVIVKKNKIIAEGHHGKYGGAHAERVALRKAGKRARGATLYVNLEPCAHHGHTPPCTDAIIAAGVRAVVVAMKDPNPWVEGGGIRQLRRAGVVVRFGVLQHEAQQLNEKFVTFVTSGLPFVGIKIAQSLDGKIADEWGQSRWITSDEARSHSHGLRSEYGAIVVGANTVIRDNPELTVRLVNGRNPMRVVVDGKLSAPTRARIFTVRPARTVVLTSARALKEKPGKVRELTRKGVEVIPVQNSTVLDPKLVVSILGRLHVSSVLIEGGAETIAKFLDAQLVQKVHCFIAPRVLGGGTEGWKLNAPLHLGDAISLTNSRCLALGHDILIEGRPHYK